MKYIHGQMLDNDFMVVEVSKYKAMCDQAMRSARLSKLVRLYQSEAGFGSVCLACERADGKSHVCDGGRCYCACEE